MNDTLIFFILAALALIFKWLTSKAENSQAEKEKRAAEPGEPNEQAAPTLRPAAQSEEERVRRFLEALGMPQGTQPPPPVRQRRVVTPAPQTPPAQRPKVKRSWAQPLPPLVTMPEDLRPPPLQTAPPPLPTMVHVEPPLPEIEDSLPPPAPVLPALRSSALRQPAPVMSLGAMLRSPASVRRAIVLREVLGPPRGLQPLDA
ncbi:MAG: hypothetical protein M3Q86_10525 [Verrucomicrobiota bacterium]|nr:hypothetical protein [Verrucomicrobiota bacterium]